MITFQDLTVSASNPKPSTCLDIPGAVDVDVTLTVDSTGETIDGQVTLVPAGEYDERALVVYGDPDTWVSGELLRRLRENVDPKDIRDVIILLEIKARKAAI